jgi:hypothetical protein
MDSNTLFLLAVAVFLIVIYFQTRPNESYRRLGPKFYTILINNNEASPEMCYDNLLVQNTPGLREWCITQGINPY